MLVKSSLHLLKANVSLVNLLLNVILSTLKISQDKDMKISQDRKIYQPHFTLSLMGLFQLYQVVNIDLGGLGTSSTIEIGLKIIIMSAPAPAANHVVCFPLSRIQVHAKCSSAFLRSSC